MSNNEKLLYSRLRLPDISLGPNSEFRLKQYRNDDHREEEPLFNMHYRYFRRNLSSPVTLDGLILDFKNTLIVSLVEIKSIDGR